MQNTPNPGQDEWFRATSPDQGDTVMQNDFGPPPQYSGPPSGSYGPPQGNAPQPGRYPQPGQPPYQQAPLYPPHQATQPQYQTDQPAYSAGQQQAWAPGHQPPPQQAGPSPVDGPSSARRPGLALPLIATLLFNVIGAVPTWLAARRARRTGHDPLRYWTAFAVGFLINSVGLLGVALAAPAVMDMVDSRFATPAVAPTNEQPDPVLESEEPSPQASGSPSASSASTSALPVEGGTPEPAVGTGTPLPTVAPRTSAPVVDIDPNEVALEELGMTRERSLIGMVFQGQWAAQLSSKYPGIEDPAQTAANGSHVFYASDILAEHEALAYRLAGADVRLFLTTDYGKRFTLDGNALWVTLVLGFDSKESVQNWCQATYPDKTGTALENLCIPRQLNPPA